MVKLVKDPRRGFLFIRPIATEHGIIEKEEPVRFVFIEVFHKHMASRKVSENDLKRILQVFPVIIILRKQIYRKEILLVAVSHRSNLPHRISTKNRDYVIL